MHCIKKLNLLEIKSHEFIKKDKKNINTFINEHAKIK